VRDGGRYRQVTAESREERTDSDRREETETEENIDRRVQIQKKKKWVATSV
jgi:hypothetical protein